MTRELPLEYCQWPKIALKMLVFGLDNCEIFEKLLLLKEFLKISIVSFATSAPLRDICLLQFFIKHTRI